MGAEVKCSLCGENFIPPHMCGMADLEKDNDRKDWSEKTFVITRHAEMLFQASCAAMEAFIMHDPDEFNDENDLAEASVLCGRALLAKLRIGV